ncbi:thioredoxin family protein [Zunongwangia atlantica]|uniref:Thioredoxin-like subdomain-containing protein n=1 Tax=Zunongwangia atlantica 22II14-10F7 TaxID=1185767 RepID=A0A1Y1T2W7_9FLAO|nr:thioredoxin fold domain-containing protein [Zunongwangia atlantica]ORL45122.1 thioredoxin-like subdomain-containing protein [Zunongwangia atlantica 22II14-10F7]
MIKNLQILILFLVLPVFGYAQKGDTINWIDFEQLEDSLELKPKKTFIYFYTDWCVYCKKMDRNAFKDPEIIKKLNSDYYAVKMNAESTDTITFEGQKFYNQQAESMRNGIHQIPLLLASREKHEFSLPAILILDKKFNVENREFEYLTTKKMLELISYN